jgi:hypothetical protein
MVFSSEDSSKRTDLEMSILRNTICDFKKCTRIFVNKNINKIGLFPSETGFIWYNFFWVRGSYIKNTPLICSDRFYYEHYIGLHANEESGNDCYSLFGNTVKCYSQPDVLTQVYNLPKLNY